MGLRHLSTLALGLEENSKQNLFVSFFYFFFLFYYKYIISDKKIVLKALLVVACTFIP